MKKKYFRLFSVILSVFLLFPTLIGCFGDNPAAVTEEPGEIYCYSEKETGADGEKVTVVPSSWYIVYGDGATDDEKTMGAFGLYQSLYDKIGKSVRVMSDFQNVPTNNEILIGTTNRQENSEIPALTYFDYGWKAVNGKLLVYGGSGEALENAVSRLMEKYCDVSAKSFAFPSTVEFLATYSYPYSVTVSGKPLSEYKIVTQEGLEASANNVFKGFGRQTGVRLPIQVIKKGEKAPSGNIISVGLEIAPNLKTGYRVEGQSLVFLNNGGKDFIEDFDQTIQAFFTDVFPKKQTVSTVQITDSIKAEYDLRMDKMTYTDQNYMTMLNNAFDAKKNEILSAASQYAVTGSGKTYYVSPNGNDSNSGLSAQSPWKTLAKVGAAQMPAGSVVLFERGGEWNREYLNLQSGVTYSAYGTGNKPMISNYVAANSTSDWVSVATGVWVYNGSFTSAPQVGYPNNSIPGTYLVSLNRSANTNDVGNIVLQKSNGKTGFGIKVMTDSVSGTTVSTGSIDNGFGVVSRGKMDYTGPASLTGDGEFYHDPNNSRLYFCCKGGNPATVYSDIKLVLYGHLVGGESTDVTLDNLALRYTGAHGVNIGAATNFTIRNCAFEWIGGSIQAYDFGGRSYPTRFGNAIQNWGACDGFYTESCYFNQIYDASWTSQISQSNGAVSCKMDDMKVQGCAFENHVYGIEIWSRGNEQQNASGNFYMSGLDVSDCYFRKNGMGFGMTRSDKGVSAAFWCSMANPVSTVPIRNSVFRDNTVWECSEAAIGGLTVQTQKGFVLKDNLFILKYGEKFGYLPAEPTAWDTMEAWAASYYPYDVENVQKLEEKNVIGKNTYSFLY